MVRRKDAEIAKSWRAGRDRLSVVIVIPSKIRKRLKIEGGEFFRVSAQDGKIVMEVLR